jgi:hypothetical protein
MVWVCRGGKGQSRERNIKKQFGKNFCGKEKSGRDNQTNKEEEKRKEIRS